MSKHFNSIEFPEIGKYDTDHLARIDGYYEDLTSGTTEQILSNMFIEDDAPYQFRTAGGALEIADRETDMLVGGSVAWNQLLDESNFRIGTDANITATLSNHIYKLSGTASTNVSFVLDTKQLIAGHKYLWFGGKKITGATLRIYNANAGTIGQIWTESKVIEVSQTQNYMVYFLVTGGAGTVVDIEVVPQLIDITQMFGSAIADYINTLETAHAGDGLAWFKRYFPNDYYPYSAPTMESVKASAHKMTGFNQWDEEWERGTISWNGQNASDSTTATRIRSKNYIPVIPNATYYYRTSAQYGNLQLFYYDANKQFVSYRLSSIQNTTDTVPSGVHYIRFYTYNSNYGATYKNDICINLHWDGERDGEYEEYKEWVYPLDSDLELRGLPKLDTDGNLVYDGDIYESDGTVTRKYGIVDLGTLTWSYNSTSGQERFYCGSLDSTLKPAVSNSVPANVICDKYVTYDIATRPDKSICVYADSGFIIRDSAYSDATTFKNSLSGVYMVYELKTATTENADTFTNPQIVDNWGTEEYVTTSVVPVGHITKYPPDLKAKLEVAPESPDADGLYLMHRESGQNSYSPYIAPDMDSKANINGYYEDMTVGRSENFVTNLTDTESEPFTFRTSGGSLEVGDREELKVAGGSIAFNQFVQNGNFETKTLWSAVSGTWSVSENIATFTKNSSSTAPQFFQYIPVIANHRYLMFATVKASVNCKWDLRFGSTYYQQDATANTWITRSYIRLSNTSGNLEINIFSNLSTEGETLQIKNVCCFDLTQMFGSTIADYIYNLEQTTAGAGVAWFKKLFPKDYYPYNAGELLHVQTSEFKTVGFNQFKVAPTFITTTTPTFDASKMVRVIKGRQYAWEHKGISGATSWRNNLICFDLNGNKIYNGSDITGGLGPNRSGQYYVDSSNGTVKRVVFTVNFDGYISCGFNLGDTSASCTMIDPCLFIRWDSSRDGEYEPYTERSYPLDDSLTLRGIPKLDSDNNLYYDGDTYEHDGTVTRRFKVLNVGTLDWSYNSSQSRFTVSLVGLKVPANNNTKANVLCAKYPTVSTNDNITTDKTVGLSVYGALGIHDTSFGTDVTAFKSAMDGVSIVCELATSTTEEAEPYQTPQIVDNWGTEEFVVPTQSGVEIPVGHETIYPISLRDKLESAPNLPDGDGDYIMRMSSGEASYAKLASQFPAPPTTNGNYVLKATVTNGTATLTWEAQS